MRSLVVAMVMLLLAAPVAAHELVIYTVIVNDEGPQPADVPASALKAGDSVWFWMKDSTENMSMVIELSKDGAVHVLQRSSTSVPSMRTEVLSMTTARIDLNSHLWKSVRWFVEHIIHEIHQRNAHRNTLW